MDGGAQVALLLATKEFHEVCATDTNRHRPHHKPTSHKHKHRQVYVHPA